MALARSKQKNIFIFKETEGLESANPGWARLAGVAEHVQPSQPPISQSGWAGLAPILCKHEGLATWKDMALARSKKNVFFFFFEPDGGAGVGQPGFGTKQEESF